MIDTVQDLNVMARATIAKIIIVNMRNACCNRAIIVVVLGGKDVDRAIIDVGVAYADDLSVT